VEKLQLRRDFPTNPLIKTYDALWESCRSIAPLQLLILEFFKLVDTFSSFVILKTGSRNWNGRRRRRRRARVRADASFFLCHASYRAILVYGRLDIIAVDQGSVVEASPSHRAVCRTHPSRDGLPTGRHGHASALRFPPVHAEPPPGRVGS
jgi:hypothetical protein